MQSGASGLRLSGLPLRRSSQLPKNPLISPVSLLPPVLSLFACLAAFFGLQATSQGAEPAPLSITWRESTATPEPRDGYASGVIGGRLIIIGGSYWQGTAGDWQKKQFSASVHAFDPRSQVWEKLPDAPVTFGYPACAQVGEEIFVLGGIQNQQPSSDIYVLSRKDGSYFWRRQGRLPEARVFASAVAVDTRLYVIGGTRHYEPFDTKGTCCTTLTATSTLWMNDTAKDNAPWQHLENFPGHLRWLHKAATNGTSLLLFGGLYQAAQNDPAIMINEVLRYDLAAHTWSRAAELPESMQLAAPVRLDDHIVLIGTEGTVMAFDCVAKRFSLLNSLPKKAMVPRFEWIAPFLVGASGENSLDGPRRRSEWTFVGELREGVVAWPH